MVAHVERSQVAEVRNAQVEVEHFLLVPLHLCRHADGSVFPLLHQGQVFQQSGRFLLARAEENADPSLNQGCKHPVVVLCPREGSGCVPCRENTEHSVRFKH